MSAVFIFDMDGVIADSWKPLYTSLCNLLHDLDQQALCNEQSIKALFEDNFMAGLKKALAPSEVSSQALMKLAVEINQSTQDTPCFDHITPVLQRLHTLFPLYLVTSNFTDSAQRFLKKHQLEVFQGIFGLDHHPSKVTKIRQLAKQYPNHTLYYIGDTLGDIREAQEAGVSSIAACWGWHDESLLKKGKPDHLIHHPKHLLDIADRHR